MLGVDTGEIRVHGVPADRAARDVAFHVDPGSGVIKDGVIVDVDHTVAENADAPVRIGAHLIMKTVGDDVPVVVASAANVDTIADVAIQVVIGDRIPSRTSAITGIDGRNRAGHRQMIERDVAGTPFEIKYVLTVIVPAEQGRSGRRADNIQPVVGRGQREVVHHHGRCRRRHE